MAIKGVGRKSEGVFGIVRRKRRRRDGSRKRR